MSEKVDTASYLAGDVAPQRDSFPSGDDHRSDQPATSQADHGPRPPAAAEAKRTTNSYPAGPAMTPDQLRAQVIREVAAEVSTLADAVDLTQRPVFDETGKRYVRIIAAYIEHWAERGSAPLPSWDEIGDPT